MRSGADASWRRTCQRRTDSARRPSEGGASGDPTEDVTAEAAPREEGVCARYYQTELRLACKRIPEDFFVATNPVVMTLVLMANYLLLMSWVWPGGVGTRLYGDFAALVHYAGTRYPAYARLACGVVALAHAASVWAAHRLCRGLGLGPRATALWLGQALALGPLSLRPLVWPQHALLALCGPAQGRHWYLRVQDLRRWVQLLGECR